MLIEGRESTGPLPDRAYARTFFRLQRRIDSIERSYQRALRELQRLEVAQA